MNRIRNAGLTRRQFHQTIGSATAGMLASHALAADAPSAAGAIRGEPTAEKVGLQILADGGNAIDAIVAAALTAAMHSGSGVQARDLLEAVIAGYEAMARLGMGADGANRIYDGIWTTYLTAPVGAAATNRYSNGKFPSPNAFTPSM